MFQPEKYLFSYRIHVDIRGTVIDRVSFIFDIKCAFLVELPESPMFFVVFGGFFDKLLHYMIS